MRHPNMFARTTTPIGSSAHRQPNPLQSYHYGRWSHGPATIGGLTGVGPRRSHDAPIRCWGPSWDPSCKVCAPLPNGQQTCTTFKVYDKPQFNRGIQRIRSVRGNPFVSSYAATPGGPAASAGTCTRGTIWNGERCIPREIRY